MILLPLENFEVNINEMTAVKDFNPNEQYKLVKAEKNVRQRATECAKHYDEMFDISMIDEEHEDEEYALLYYREVKKRNEQNYQDVWYNDPKGFPSIKEVVLGLWEL